MIKQATAVGGGKYTFQRHDDDYRITVLRHGEAWMVISEGHKAIAALMDEVEALEEALDEAKTEIESIRGGN